VSGPVDHRKRIEGWMRDSLTLRGATVGYAVQLASVEANEANPSGMGWLLVVSMRHSLLGMGDLVAPAVLPAFGLDMATVQRYCTQALEALDAKAAEDNRAAMAAAAQQNGPMLN
jgi:hypothetical protein